MQSQSPLQPIPSTQQHPLVANLRHLFKLAITETWTIISPQHACQYFDPPFNTSPYFDVIMKTLTKHLHDAQTDSMAQFDQMLHNEIQLEDKFIVLERLILNELLTRGNNPDNKDNYIEQNAVLSKDWDVYISQQQQASQHQNLQQQDLILSPTPSKAIEISMNIHTKRLAIEKQQEQIKLLEAMLLDIDLENKNMALVLSKRYKGSAKLVHLIEELTSQTQQLEPQINDIFTLMNGE